MKSCFSLTFVLIVFFTLFSVGGLLWYLSYTSEFSRKDTHTSALPPARPAAPAPPAPAAPAKPTPLPDPAPTRP